MGLFLYKVVKHQNGWAYRLEDTYSPVFTTQWEATAAAKKAAREMHEHGDFTQVKVKDGPLGWRTELVINGRHTSDEAA
jgi:hypothetical protein